MSEFIDIFVKFSNFMSRGGASDSLFCPEGRALVHNDCPRGRIFAPFTSCPRSGGGGGGVGGLWIKLIPALIVRPLASMSTDLAFGEVFK